MHLHHGRVGLRGIGLGHLGGKARQVEDHAGDVQLVSAAGVLVVVHAVLVGAAVAVVEPSGARHRDDPVARIVALHVVGKLQRLVLRRAVGAGEHALGGVVAVVVLVEGGGVGRAAHLMDGQARHRGHRDVLAGERAVALHAVHRLGGREGGVGAAHSVDVHGVAGQHLLHLILGKLVQGRQVGGRRDVVALLLEAGDAVGARGSEHLAGQERGERRAVHVQRLGIEAAPLPVDQLAVDGAAAVVVGHAAYHVSSRSGGAPARALIVGSGTLGHVGRAQRHPCRVHGVVRVVGQRETPAGVGRAHEGVDGIVRLVVGTPLHGGVHLAGGFGVQEGVGADARLDGICLGHQRGGIGDVHAVGTVLAGQLPAVAGRP